MKGKYLLNFFRISADIIDTQYNLLSNNYFLGIITK
jgi:hypothetical protein